MSAALAGTLDLQIFHDGCAVTRVHAASSRPQASRLLKGRTQAQAEQMVQLVFGICIHAQRAAARTAFAAAGGVGVSQHAEMERAVRCEAMQEHLWRLLLDWPQLLGLSPLQQDFVRWHSRLREAAAQPESLQAEIEGAWLGMPAAEWMALECWEDFWQWWEEAGSPAAQLLRMLAREEVGLPQPNTALLPLLTAREACVAWPGQWGDAFAARPELAGAPHETGALAAYADHAWLADVLLQRPSRVLARTLSRIREMLQLATGTDPCRIDGAGDEAGVGLALVRTARGLLMHRICLEDGLVEDYRIVAPTEWNFHPQGSLAAGLVGLKETMQERLVHNARMLTLSLDPCLEYQLVTCHA